MSEPDLRTAIDTLLQHHAISYRGYEIERNDESAIHIRLTRPQMFGGQDDLRDMIRAIRDENQHGAGLTRQDTPDSSLLIITGDANISAQQRLTEISEAIKRLP